MKDNRIDISIFQMRTIRHKIDEMDCTFESGGNMGGSSFREIAISPEGLICLNLFFPHKRAKSSDDSRDSTNRMRNSRPRGNESKRELKRVVIKLHNAGSLAKSRDND